MISKSLQILLTIFVLNQAVMCSYNIEINLLNFENPHGILNNSDCCSSSYRNGKCTIQCSTNFKFCFKTNLQSDKCIKEQQTLIIGDNLISEEQFKLTTSFLEFTIDNKKNESIYLSIQAFNDFENQKELISEWILPFETAEMNKIIKFSQTNPRIYQKFTFNYSLKCSEGYYGQNCEYASCREGCDLERGGYCENPNECLCKKGWIGYNCDKRQIQEARSYMRLLVEQNNLRCLNGGSRTVNGECICPPGFSGDHCQTRRLESQCGLFVCYNGGTCFVDNNNNYACSCHPAFTGNVCETKIQTTTTTSTTTTTTQSTTTSDSSTESLDDVNMFSILMIPSELQESKIKDTIIKKSPKSASPSSSFSIHEIILIIVVGVGLPIFSILVTILLCIHYRSKSVKKASTPASINTQVEKINKTENIYVKCVTEKDVNYEDKDNNKNNSLNIKEIRNKEDVNYAKNNLLLKSNNKKLAVSTITNEYLDANRCCNKVDLNKSKLNDDEQNIYSSCNYSDIEIDTCSKNYKLSSSIDNCSSYDTKKSTNNYSHETYNVMASFV